MDIFLKDCYTNINWDIVETLCMPESNKKLNLQTLIKLVESYNTCDIVLKYNEEGKLHSKYLDDRYEPAITISYEESITYCYLFDGKIKDCVHPFYVSIYNDDYYVVRYYSSERIRQTLPILINENVDGIGNIEYTFNQCVVLSTILDGYASETKLINKSDYVKQNYTLHDCMEPTMPFKFAD